MDIIEKNINYNCPFCNEKHEVIFKVEPSKALINETPVEYNESYYYCSIEDEEFIPKDLLKKNLLAARDAYRTLKGLLTSEEIKNVRKQYNLTQKEFAQLLGWGDVTIQRYETKLIQDETFDQQIRYVRDNPKLALEELEKHKSKFDDVNRFNAIELMIKSLVKTKSIQYLTKQIIESYYIDFRNVSEDNGFKLLDLEKVENMITFFAQNSSRLYKVKLMKLLWYADSLFFKRTQHSMSGLVYAHLPYGAVPIAHEDILRYVQTSINVMEEEYENGSVGYKITLKNNYMKYNLSKDEIIVLHEVLQKFDNMGSRKISDYMHKEVAHRETDEGEIISYRLANQIEDFLIDGEV